MIKYVNSKNSSLVPCNRIYNVQDKKKNIETSRTLAVESNKKKNKKNMPNRVESHIIYLWKWILILY